MAPPRKDIDPEKIRRLAGMGLTTAEIAAALDCSKRHLETRYYAALKDGRERMTGSLKRKQYAAAMRGNVAMLIWLGKQHLGQRERVEHGPERPPENRDLVIPDADDRPGCGPESDAAAAADSEPGGAG